MALLWGPTPYRRRTDDEIADTRHGRYRVKMERTSGGFFRWAAFHNGQRLRATSTAEDAKRVAEDHAARTAYDAAVAEIAEPAASGSAAGRAEPEAAPSSEQRIDPQPSSSPSGEQ